jgi:ubiquinone/menaquinone biosynthesis C-methylase UbiE
MNQSHQSNIPHWNWEANFWDDYTANSPDDDVRFLVDEAQKAGAPVLEIGCGTGRVVIPIAQAGINITGLDFSPQMLANAREKIANLDLDVRGRIELVEGDMRDFSLGRQFNLIAVTWCFFFLTTPVDQQKTLRCIHTHLRPRGRLILINTDPKVELIAARLGPLGTALEKTDEFVLQANGHRVVVWRSREIDLEPQLTKTIEIHEELDIDGRVIQRTQKKLTSRFTYRYEMQYLLELCGYRIEALYGDFKRGPFEPGELQIWVARKKE